MASNDFTRGGLDRQRRVAEKIVRPMHVSLGRGFFVLLNGHVAVPKKIAGNPAF
jgi:hypothetical protein